MAAPETGPSIRHLDGKSRGSTYSCSRGAGGTKVSRNTLRGRGRERQTVSKGHLGPLH